MLKIEEEHFNQKIEEEHVFLFLFPKVNAQLGAFWYDVELQSEAVCEWWGGELLSETFCFLFVYLFFKETIVDFFFTIKRIEICNDAPDDESTWLKFFFTFLVANQESLSLFQTEKEVAYVQHHLIMS